MPPLHRKENNIIVKPFVLSVFHVLLVSLFQSVQVYVLLPMFSDHLPFFCWLYNHTQFYFTLFMYTVYAKNIPSPTPSFNALLLLSKLRSPGIRAVYSQFQWTLQVDYCIDLASTCMFSCCESRVPIVMAVHTPAAS